MSVANRCCISFRTTSKSLFPLWVARWVDRLLILVGIFWAKILGNFISWDYILEEGLLYLPQNLEAKVQEGEQEQGVQEVREVQDWLVVTTAKVVKEMEEVRRPH